MDIRGWSVDEKILEEYLSRGLSNGMGEASTQVCVEAAICLALGIKDPSDNPPCTDRAVRRYKIRLNDGPWSSPEARAKGMRGLAYAQIGTNHNFDRVAWAKRLAELTIRELLSELLDERGLTTAAQRCRDEGSKQSATKARKKLRADAAVYAADAAAADAADAAAAAAAAAAYAAAYAAAAAAAAAADAAKRRDHYLTLSASLALRALQEQGFGTDQTVEVTPKA